ncbi:MFS transporter [Halorarum salinum]|uniref:MFS transporter n=1 Tax=Halorarum salinum TaxID=2743089 RepID=A0A7D5QDQ5_9EURY|nr:MFS transporter [Halobaculum salinum]QLG63460.1 MFS transporter [Halobaculum salinum]
MNWPYRYTALSLCTLAFFGTMVARLVISPIVPDLTAEFEVSNGTVGLALSGMWVAYAFSQFPSGVLGDRLGERTVILVAVGGTAATSAGLAVAPSFPLFLLSTVSLGAAAGLHYSVATTFLTRQFDDIGRAIGVHVAGGPLAGLLAPPAAAVVGARYGWRAAIALGAVVAVPVFVAFALSIRPTDPRRPDQPVRERFELAPLAELLSRPEIRYTTALAIVGAFTWQATASFLPTFLAAHHGLSTTAAGVLFSVYFVVHGASQPVLGSLSDRLSRESVVLGTMLLGIVGYGVLVVGDRPGVVLAGVLCVGVAMSWGAPLQSRFMDVLSEAERGAGFGLVRTAYMTLGATGSVVVGTVADLVGWSASFGLLSAVMALGAAAVAGNRALGLGY